MCASFASPAARRALGGRALRPTVAPKVDSSSWRRSATHGSCWDGCGTVPQCAMGALTAKIGFLRARAMLHDRTAFTTQGLSFHPATWRRSRWGVSMSLPPDGRQKSQTRCSSQQLCAPLFRQAASCGISRAFFKWPCGLMDKALVFGTKDCRFESCQGHFLLSAPCAGTPVVRTHSTFFGIWREWTNAFIRKLGVPACDTFCRR